MQIPVSNSSPIHPTGKLLSYNCSPSFNWKKLLNDTQIADFQKRLGALGYKFQFITLAGFHSLNHGMYDLASDYNVRGMTAYAELQVGCAEGSPCPTCSAVCILLL